MKKTFIQEQVKFTAPVSDDPVVAIIGGGMSGLLCALYLDKRAIRSTVFDTVCFFSLLAFPPFNFLHPMYFIVSAFCHFMYIVD